ncbi:hypothetical protein Droror1_Dr00011910 [Drosera rotundifolia]
MVEVVASSSSCLREMVVRWGEWWREPSDDGVRNRGTTAMTFEIGDGGDAKAQNNPSANTLESNAVLQPHAFFKYAETQRTFQTYLEPLAKAQSIFQHFSLRASPFFSTKRKSDLCDPPFPKSNLKLTASDVFYAKYPDDCKVLGIRTRRRLGNSDRVLGFVCGGFDVVRGAVSLLRFWFVRLRSWLRVCPVQVSGSSKLGSSCGWKFDFSVEEAWEAKARGLSFVVVFSRNLIRGSLDRGAEGCHQDEQSVSGGVAVDAFVAARADLVAGLGIRFVENLEVNLNLLMSCDI